MHWEHASAKKNFELLATCRLGRGTGRPVRSSLVCVEAGMPLKQLALLPGPWERSGKRWCIYGLRG